jgi:hypothetical protein
MSSTAKKTLTVTAHAQIAVVFLAFALMVSLSSWFMNNILRKHLVYNAQMVLNGLETQIEVDLLEPRTILGSLSQTVRSMILEGDNADILQRYLRDITDYVLLDNRQLPGFGGIYGFFYFSGLTAWIEYLQKHMFPRDAPGTGRRSRRAAA